MQATKISHNLRKVAVFDSKMFLYHYLGKNCVHKVLKVLELKA